MKIAFDEARRAAFRALDAGGAAPGCDEDCGWACAWLEAAGYPGLKMLVEALDETPRDKRRPSLQAVYGIVDLDNVSCVFSAPGLVDMARAEGRVVLNRVRHGLYVLPFAVRAGLAVGCPVDPSFAIGGSAPRTFMATRSRPPSRRASRWTMRCGRRPTPMRGKSWCRKPKPPASRAPVRG